MNKKIKYDGRAFNLGSAGTYYYTTITISLHRYKYLKEKGPIPIGFHVHHIDEDSTNNDINNLEVLSPEEHSKKHPNTPEKVKKWQAAGIKAAVGWHSTEEGKAWHDQHYQLVKDAMHKKYIRKCIFCKKKIETKIKNGNCFCSNNCRAAHRRKNNPDMKKVNCLTCGVEFETRKYATPKRYCSKKCRPTPNPKGYHSRKK